MHTADTFFLCFSKCNKFQPFCTLCYYTKIISFIEIVHVRTCINNYSKEEKKQCIMRVWNIKTAGHEVHAA